MAYAYTPRKALYAKKSAASALTNEHVVMGTPGDDTLWATSADDYLIGDEGDDLYHFHAFEGIDTIDDAGGSDTVRLGPGPSAQPLALWRDEYTLYLGEPGAAPLLTLRDWYYGTTQQIEWLLFDDGTQWDLVAAATSAIFAGTQGNDLLDGLASDDTLDGLGGDDWLNGGAGNDRYVFKPGGGRDSIDDDSGFDTVLVDGAWSAADLRLTRESNSLYLTSSDGADRMGLRSWFSDPNAVVERVVFADGTIWTAAMLAATPLRGDAQGNTLNGSVNNDTFDGAGGNDRLFGGKGDDTYLFDQGDGSDVIVDDGGTDVIVMGTGLSPENVMRWRSEADLVVGVAGTDDLLRVQGWFSAVANRVDSVRFADGALWDSAYLAGAQPLGTAGDDLIQGSSANDSFTGLGGNDRISSLVGNDTLDGGSGDDYLEGGLGNDTYLFERGHGVDEVYDFSGTETIKYGSSVPRASDVEVWRDATNLYLTLAGGDGEILVRDWFVGTGNRVEYVYFGDGGYLGSSNMASAKYGGGSGADVLNGSAATESFDGRGGNDILNGLAGNDTYLFDLDDGFDTVVDTGGTDRVKFGPGIAPENVASWRDASSLYFGVNGGASVVKVQGYFDAVANQIDDVAFHDGTVWAKARLTAAPFLATEGADQLEGAVLADTMLGLGGDDQLSGHGGADTFDGGPGNDWLIGGEGNDNFLFKAGDGQDVVSDHAGTDNILFGPQLTPGTIVLWRDHTDLHLDVRGSGEGVTVRGWFDSMANRVENVRFADGTWWGATALSNAMFLGTAGGDTLTGTSVNDTLNGAAGDDLLLGGAGNDSYLFGRGYGSDSVQDTSGSSDTVRFDADVLPADVTLARVGNHMVMSIRGTDDKLTLLDWYVGTASQVESARFANGTVWYSTELKQRAVAVLDAIEMVGVAPAAADLFGGGI